MEVYWLGIKVPVVKAVIACFQVPAALGFPTWMAWAYCVKADTGVLTYPVGSWVMRDVVVGATLGGGVGVALDAAEDIGRPERGVAGVAGADVFDAVGDGGGVHPDDGGDV
jgi:hypothetical protein